MHLETLRIFYFLLNRALIECHLDAHRQSDASQIAAAASTFIKAHVPDLYKTVFGLMVKLTNTFSH